MRRRAFLAGVLILAAIGSQRAVTAAAPAMGSRPAPGTCPASSAPPASYTWQPARPDYAWSFPRDHWKHDGYRTEWWYVTGHLWTGGPTPRRFAYQFTFFRVGLLPQMPPWNSRWTCRNLVMGHAAITDLDSGEHVFSELLDRETPFLGGFPPPPEEGASRGATGFPADPHAEAASRDPGPLLAWSRAPAGTDTTWTLRWNGGAFDLAVADSAQGIAYALTTHPEKPLVLEGADGYSLKADSAGTEASGATGAAARAGDSAAVSAAAGPPAASQYYSFTRLRTTGRLTIGGRTFDVRGQSWMDKEFGSGQLAPDQAGWDWFSLQLDDGREVMLYLLRNRSGAISHAGGTWIDRRGQPQVLAHGEFQVTVLETWRSPGTGAVYPSRWDIRLSVPGKAEGEGGPGAFRFEVRPEVADQENRSRLAGGLFYWEGGVRITSPSGATLGRGFVELTGYGTNNRPAL